MPIARVLSLLRLSFFLRNTGFTRDAVTEVEHLHLLRWCRRVPVVRGRRNNFFCVGHLMGLTALHREPAKLLRTTGALRHQTLLASPL